MVGYSLATAYLWANQENQLKRHLEPVVFPRNNGPTRGLVLVYVPIQRRLASLGSISFLCSLKGCNPRTRYLLCRTSLTVNWSIKVIRDIWIKHDVVSVLRRAEFYDSCINIGQSEYNGHRSCGGFSLIIHLLLLTRYLFFFVAPQLGRI